MSKNLTALLDLDAMLHIIANVQFSAGNRDRPLEVKQHVQRFVSNVCTNATEKEVIMFYQKAGHTNYRNIILPEYKSHRTASDAILCWKDVILEEFHELGAIGLQHIESDDAQSILAEHIGYDKIVVVTGDKDMAQIPGLNYNPFKGNLKPEDRWKNVNVYQANRFFWEQVLAGDPTDMPGALCGIEGIGMGKARKLCDNDLPFITIIQNAYKEKYGAAGFDRANLTYKMVRLLRLDGNEYIGEEADKEISWLLQEYPKFIISATDKQSKVFSLNPLNLFQ
jgi:5'-3' exonuclease